MTCFRASGLGLVAFGFSVVVFHAFVFLGYSGLDARLLRRWALLWVLYLYIWCLLRPFNTRCFLFAVLRSPFLLIEAGVGRALRVRPGLLLKFGPHGPVGHDGRKSVAAKCAALITAVNWVSSIVMITFCSLEDELPKDGTFWFLSILVLLRLPVSRARDVRSDGR